MLLCFFFFFFNDTATTEIYTLSLHDALPISYGAAYADLNNDGRLDLVVNNIDAPAFIYEGVQPKDDAHHYLQITLAGESPNRSEEHTSELQSQSNLVCRLLLEKKKYTTQHKQ